MLFRHLSTQTSEEHKKKKKKSPQHCSSPLVLLFFFFPVFSAPNKWVGRKKKEEYSYFLSSFLMDRRRVPLLLFGFAL
jgi:hypothetical protein